jgi:hypothetical protein
MSFDSSPRQRFPVDARISMIRDGAMTALVKSPFAAAARELTSVQGLVASGVE